VLQTHATTARLYGINQKDLFVSKQWVKWSKGDTYEDDVPLSRW
jgi:hypothetical protein